MNLILRFLLSPFLLAGVYGGIACLLTGRMVSAAETALYFGLSGMLLCLCADRLLGLSIRMEPVRETDAPELHAIVRELSSLAGIPMPRVYILPSASGQILAARSLLSRRIAVSQGVFSLLNPEELLGCAAHAVGRLKSPSSLSATMTAAASGLVAFPFRPMFAKAGKPGSAPLDPRSWACSAARGSLRLLAYFSVSRDYAANADLEAVSLCGDPLYLAGALDKLSIHSARFPLRNALPCLIPLLLFEEEDAGRLGRLFPVYGSTAGRAARLAAQSCSDNILIRSNDLT